MLEEALISFSHHLEASPSGEEEADLGCLTEVSQAQLELALMQVAVAAIKVPNSLTKANLPLVKADAIKIPVMGFGSEDLHFKFLFSS